MFVIYLSAAATSEAKKTNHKTISTNHIFDALQEIEFESFIEPLKESLEVYRKTVKDKRESKAHKEKKDKKPGGEDDKNTEDVEEITG